MNLNLNINEDFFTQYPDLEITFAHIKKEYKKEASKAMWALILDFHPKSMYHNIELKERRQMLDIDYLGWHLDWEKHEGDMKALHKFFLPKAVKYLLG